jgi:RNA polymerase sigma-70 factor, ECF subfamily
MSTSDILDAFLAGLQAPVRPAAQEREDLGIALEELWTSVSRTWPGAALSPGPCGAFLAARLPAGQPALEGLRRLRVEDLCLAWACLQGCEPALRSFRDLCRGVVDAALRGFDPSGGLVDEVLQGLLRRLLTGEGDEGRKLEQYRGQSGLGAFVRVAAVRQALNLRRRQRRECALEDDLLLALSEDPELTYLKQYYRQEFKQVFQQVLARLSARERNLLSHQIVDALTLEQMGALYRVNRSTVCRWLQAIRDRLRLETRAGLAEHLAIDPDDVDSILHLVLSRIDTSLARVLADESPPTPG